MSDPDPAVRPPLAAALLVAISLMLGGLGCSDRPDGGGGDTAGSSGDTGVETDTATDTGSTPDTEIPDAGETGQTDTEDTEEEPDTGPGLDVPEWDTSVPDGGMEGDGGLKPMNLKVVRPDRGPVAGNTKFVIEGEGFTRETSIFFGSRRAEVNLVDDRLVGQTPQASGPGPVSVKALDPTSGEDVLQGAYTYTTTLRLDTVTPKSLPTEGGVEVTLTGESFDGETRVSFDGHTALRHTLIDDQTMRVLAPSNEAGPADVRVTNRDESVRATDAVTYEEALAVDGVSPATGPTAGGTTVTLTGAGFATGMTVTFGGKQATVSTVNAKGTRATVSTPAHTSGLVDVGVQTPDGSATLRPEAFYYRSSSSEFTVAAVTPDIGRESGGVEATLVGAGLDSNGLTVTFGGKMATVKSSGPGSAVVTVPAHTPGKVDVTVQDGQGRSATLTKGFEYVADLAVQSVAPTESDTAGGTKVTVTGKGFNGASRVEFGGVAASFSVVDAQTIEATAPAHAPGTVDLVVERGELSASLEDGFTYTEDLEIHGFSPVRGSIAGNTYVVIRGRGFAGKLDVSFGQNPAADVTVLDNQTLAVRTPRHGPGLVDVSVTGGQTTKVAGQKYTYFNPGSRTGGTWGGAIQGAVNVSVYSRGGSPVQGAFVMLSTNPETTYKGQTDANGLVTLSGPDVYGEQTITATAPGYSSATVQHVNAENITIFLSPPPSQGPPPPGPPTATFEGKLTGLNKVATPGPNEFHMAVVFATKKSPWSRSPDTGNGNVLMSDGPYKLTTRIGDLAIVAVGGLYNSDTQELTPLMMGVKRYQFAAEGKTYKRDINLDIPLNSKLRFKLKNPPHGPDGPDYNRVTPWLDFGFEGVFGQLTFAEGTSSIVTADHLAGLTGKLSDVQYMAIGGSYTKNANGNPGIPQSVVIKRKIKKTNQLVDMPKMVGIADIITPGPGERPRNNLISWKLNTSNQPDFYFVQILTPMNRSVWDAFVPGSATSVRLPNFPDFSHLPPMKRPVPYPGGTYQLQVIGIRHPGASFGNFSYSDLSIDKWEAYSASGHVIQF